ncbi:MAG TPA: sigma-70 family RNA polymerase sigma factor [Bryobacteraceae bacterium]|nr:sigma-70 family RNA polymerase sigma factor [Bryobacteraceae bacterium]
MNIGDASLCQSEFRTLPDDTLMTFVQQGHSDALAVLFDRYRRLVLSVAWQILRDRGEAEDLVQSVFLEILQSASKFDSAKGTAKSWILQYAYHRSFNRKKYLNLRGISNFSESFVPEPDRALPGCICSFEMLESEWFVQEALGHLNRKQRQILELAFYEGMSMREAAEITGQSFDTVRHHFYRAIGTLRSLMIEDRRERGDKLGMDKAKSFVASSIPSRRRSLKSARPLIRASLRPARIGPSFQPRAAKAVLAGAG